jgi:hypothetical protein
VAGYNEDMRTIILCGLPPFTKAEGQKIRHEDNIIHSKVLNTVLKSERIKKRTIILQSDSDNEIEIDLKAVSETGEWF